MMHRDNKPLGTTKGARTQPWPNMILDGANYACNFERMIRAAEMKYEGTGQEREGERVAEEEE